MSSEDPMPAEMEREYYLEGIRLFNSHEYFEAHEAWEQIWHHASGVRHEFYQGLIQVAVAFEHYRRGNARGVISLARSYPEHFRRVPERFMGMDVHRFLREADAALRPVIEADPVPERGEIAFDPARAPRIRVEGELDDGC